MYSVGLPKDFIFLHAPKTGGGSIKDCLIRNFPNENLKYTSKGYHAPLSAYKNAIENDPNCRPFNDYIVFGCVRNPWDKMVSLYHWKTKGTHLDDYKDIYDQAQNRIDLKRKPLIKPLNFNIPADISFHEFINKHYEYLEKKEYAQFNDYWLSCFDDPDVVVECNIIRFDLMAQHWAAMAKILDLKDTKLLNIHKTRHKHYSSYYDAFTCGVVYGMFANEINTYHLSFNMEDNNG